MRPTTERLHSFTNVVSLPFAPYVHLVLGFDGRGWCFFGWTDRSGRYFATEPCGSDRDVYFEKPGGALAYFRRKLERQTERVLPRAARRRRFRLAS